MPQDERAGNEYADLTRRLRRLNYALMNQRESVIGTRAHQAQLIKKYMPDWIQRFGSSTTPPEAYMRKYYRDLFNTNVVLERGEKEIENMEFHKMQLQRRRKELAIILGIREHEIEPHQPYPAMKKFVPPENRDVKY